jgi:hypothetical protein
MVLVSNNGRMEQGILGNGRIIKLQVMEYFIMLMEIFMKDIG